MYINTDKNVFSDSVHPARVHLHSLTLLVTLRRLYHCKMGACGCVVTQPLCRQPEGREFGAKWGGSMLSLYLILPAARVLDAYWFSNRNEYKTVKRNFFWRVERGRCAKLTDLPPPVSRLSRQCGILNISQPYGLLRPVTGTASLFYTLYHFMLLPSPAARYLHLNKFVPFALQLSPISAVPPIQPELTRTNTVVKPSANITRPFRLHFW
jgi:hypothetical protein